MPKMRRKADLPSKTCAACGKPFAWRKKWGEGLGKRALTVPIAAAHTGWRCRWQAIGLTLPPDTGRGESGMTERVDRAGLQVAQALADFVEQRALPGTGVAGRSLLGWLRRALWRSSGRGSPGCWRRGRGCRIRSTTGKPRAGRKSP